jgi:hypothetical protein
MAGSWMVTVAVIPPYHGAMTIGEQTDEGQAVTVTLSPDTLARARSQAERAGVSLSAWLDRAARAQALRDAGHQYDRWLAENPEIADQVKSWRAMQARTMSARWRTEPGTGTA